MIETYYLVVDKQTLQNAIDDMKSRPLGSYMVEIVQPKKTKAQRNYWHMCMQILAKAAGYRLHELKTIIKDDVFGEVRFIDRKGKERVNQIESESLGTHDYNLLIDDTFDKARMIDCPMPDPERHGMKGILKMNDQNTLDMKG